LITGTLLINWNNGSQYSRCLPTFISHQSSCFSLTAVSKRIDSVRC